ncbi:MAG: ABC transporter permease [Tepidiformaceae bacterium]
MSQPGGSAAATSGSSGTGAGSIYDLGYRHYEGERLGRGHAFMALYWYTVRSAFGIGRRPSSKIIPWALFVVALLPAAIRLGVAAIATDRVDVAQPSDYFNLINLVVALFCAAVAPEVIGRDQRTHTLVLYFSRTLSRRDYVLAKLAAFVTALFALTLVPLIVLYIGNTFTGSDSLAYVKDNWADIPRIFGSSIADTVVMASIALVIAAQTSRRSYATVSVIAAFIVTSVLGAIFVEDVGGAGHVAALLSPFDLLRGLNLWIFHATADGGVVVDANLAGWVYGVAALVIFAGATALLVRRYEKLNI